MLIQSIYTLLFCKEEKFYLYNSRSNFFSEISKELYDAIESCNWDSLPQGIVDELKTRELICESEDRYNYYYSRLMEFNARNNDRSFMTLVLAPTTACNFACPYCFEPKKVTKTITDDVINALSCFVKDHKDVKRLSITWYGGEPLLAFDKMKAIFEMLSEEGMPEIASQSIITNGYCFTDEVISFLKEKGCEHIQITVDGLYEKHSATRCLKNSNADTFWPIVRNIDKLIKELTETRINIRVNINKDNYKDFIAVSDFFKDRYPGNKMISVYPGIIREENEDKRTLCASSFSSSELLMLNEFLREEGFNMSDFPKKSTRGCMAQNINAYLIGPEGEIYKCWNDVGDADAVIGNIGHKELNNPSRYIKYAVQAIPYNEDCRKCHAFPICNGGCAYHRYRNMFEGCHFDLCSPYKDKDKLFDALLSGTLDI